MYARNLLTYAAIWVSILGSLNLVNGFVDGVRFLPNPTKHLTLPEIIKHNGYPEETYNISTPDGYILQLHRIPYGVKSEEGNQYPILLIHGFHDSSYCWIANGPNRSLAYLLADQGYDVWMINVRGNTYSRNHAQYTTKDREFWDFSFHEIATYDLPATIDFILNKTNHKQLLCISMFAGNPEFYIMLSELPAYNNKIIAQISLALYYHDFPSKTTSSSKPYDLSSSAPFLERSSLLEHAIQILSRIRLFADYNVYDFILYLAFRLLPDHINREIMRGVYNHYPAGSSFKVSQHTAQLANSLSKFNYGPEQNLKIYGTTYPPAYNISNIRVPVRIYHAKYDHNAYPEEIQLLYDKLPVKAGVKMISDPGFSHLDFLYNQNVNELLNNDVLKFVNEIVKNGSNGTGTF